MGLSTQKSGKVAELARRGDLPGLLEAVEHTDVQTTRNGKAVDAGAPVREAAILGLAEIGDRDSASVIVKALSDKSDRVRCAAIRTLCEWGEALPLAEAMAWLPAQGSSRALASAAIAKLADPKAADVLARSLIHGSAQEGLWEEEAEIVAGLCRASDEGDTRDAVLDTLLAALDDEDAAVAGRAEDFLLWLGEDAAHAVAEAVRNGTRSHRLVWVLGQIGGADALEPLMEALEHADSRARAEACVALGDLRDPIAINALLYATHDADHVVRVKAAAAIDSIGVVALLVGLTRPGAPAHSTKARRSNGHR